MPNQTAGSNVLSTATDPNSCLQIMSTIRKLIMTTEKMKSQLKKLVAENEKMHKEISQ